MAWRLEDYVAHGEIDNRIQGCVTGRIWLAGVDEPLVLELEGNCQPDLAGCLLHFEKDNALPLNIPPPVLLQCGFAGNMTASRKVCAPDIPLEEFLGQSATGWPVPEHLTNCLYLEWYTEASGRMVIESANFRMQISEPAWRSAPLEEAENVHGPSLANLNTARDDFSKTFEEKETQAPWDEFRHEQALRQSDALTEKFGKLFEKYRNHPDRDRIIAREMGWDWMEELTEEESTTCGEYCDPDFADFSEPDCCGEWVKPEPDPTREGVDWIRNSDGDIRHPLYDRAFQMTSHLHAFCRDNGLMEEEKPDLEELFAQTSPLAAKLAGALTDLADGTNLYEPGFVVALLKRALAVLNQALAALNSVESKSLLPLEMTTAYRAELLSIREAILTLIQEFRKKIS
ncbi:MAG: hypothetical protein EOP84_07460 [Verrucomicrobiaceae bacterium]|nr:MAG: hypothetical protein EOP84_07460 [Verrucomicrobiaceae bacterium]